MRLLSVLLNTSELRQVALHGYGGTYLIFSSLASLSEGFTSCTQILSVGPWERKIYSSSGKACFLLSVPALLVWKGISHSTHDGAAEGSVDSYTPFKDY